MKKILLLFLLANCVTLLFAQKGSSQFAISGGYEHFPELHEGKGYNIGIEYKHYVHSRVFILANFNAGINDGSKHIEYTNNNIPYKFDLQNNVRDYMIGFGIGGDILQKGKHKIYLQGTAGLGSSDRNKDGITSSPAGAYDIVRNFEKTTRFAISATVGYDYLVANWIAIGVNYTGFQVGYEYNNSYNAKISLIF